MPVYDYKCSVCGHGFEQKQGFGDNGNSCCPKCGAKASRIFIPVPVIFKGSGFYVTDNRSAGKSTIDESKSSPTETKPAAPKPT